jgi:hypothetical protein
MVLSHICERYFFCQNIFRKMLLLDVVSYLDPNEIEKCCLVGKLWKATLENYNEYLENARLVTAKHHPTSSRYVWIDGENFEVYIFGK